MHSNASSSPSELLFPLQVFPSKKGRKTSPSMKTLVSSPTAASSSQKKMSPTLQKRTNVEAAIIWSGCSPPSSWWSPYPSSSSPAAAAPAAPSARSAPACSHQRQSSPKATSKPQECTLNQGPVSRVKVLGKVWIR